MKKYTGILFIFVAMFLLPNMVSAHTELKSSTPADGDTVTAALTEIDLTFATPIEPMTVLKVTDASGKEVELKSNNGKSSIEGTFKEPLANGAYTVEWRIIGEDGHNITGTYSFKVAVPADQAQSSTGNDAAASAAEPDKPAHDQQPDQAQTAENGTATNDNTANAAGNAADTATNTVANTTTNTATNAVTNAAVADTSSTLPAASESKSNLSTGWLIAIGLGILAVIGIGVRMFRK